jgi:hypothetical protein
MSLISGDPFCGYSNCTFKWEFNKACDVITVDHTEARDSYYNGSFILVIYSHCDKQPVLSNNRATNKYMRTITE